jgi:hypothetical protein
MVIKSLDIPCIHYVKTFATCTHVTNSLKFKSRGKFKTVNTDTIYILKVLKVRVLAWDLGFKDESVNRC